MPFAEQFEFGPRCDPHFACALVTKTEIDVECSVWIDTHVLNSSVDDLVGFFAFVHLSSFFQPRLFGSQDEEVLSGIDRFLLNVE